MNKSTVLILTVICVLVISGCTRLEEMIGAIGIGTTSIDKIVENPERYLGEEVTIKGNITSSCFGIFCGPFFLTDSKGYTIFIDDSCRKNRVLEIGKSYDIKGTIEEEADIIKIVC